MKNFIFVVACALISGCASVSYNGSSIKTTTVDTPKAGEITVAYVGDYLLKKGEIVEESILRVNRSTDGFAYTIPGGIYQQLGFDQNASYFSSANVTKSIMADPHKALLVEKENPAELCVVTVFNAKACYKADFEITSKISERGSSFQQTLIYSGRIGNKINIGYREFSNSLARPAFNNDVEYDLSASNIIGYKGAQLEILNADNTSIKYRVVKSFPQAR